MGRHEASTSLLSVVIFAIGIAIVIRTFAAGGGAVATGVILGVLFMAAGAGRLYIGHKRR